jgi:hypothetical protein
MRRLLLAFTTVLPCRLADDVPAAQGIARRAEATPSATAAWLQADGKAIRTERAQEPDGRPGAWMMVVSAPEGFGALTAGEPPSPAAGAVEERPRRSRQTGQ